MSKKNDDEIRPYHVFAIVVTAFALIFGLTWAVEGNDFFLSRYFGPKKEQIRRETFEQSKAYREGQAQELRRMQSEYIRSPETQKQALASVILHEFADCDETALPPDLATFLHDIRQGVRP